MTIRKRAYYQLSKNFRKSYHARIRAGESADIYAVYQEMNEKIVALFAHTGVIDATTAAALGHEH